MASTPSAAMEDRADGPADWSVDRFSTPLLGSPNRFKLAVFAFNSSGGNAPTAAEGTIAVSWSESLRIARRAEQLGLEAVIPLARWRGFGGRTNPGGRSFESVTWAAGIGALTSHIQVFATVHVPTVHPARLAKEASTVDHITDGRFALNVVAGWNMVETGWFGVPQRNHDERYGYAEEWLQLLKRFWCEVEPFAFHGRYFDVEGGISEPKPVQRPYPLLMSAGSSRAGRDFAVRHADINFVSLPDFHQARDMIALSKEGAAAAGRRLLIFDHAQITCADSEREARRRYDYCVHEMGDFEAAHNFLAGAIENSQSLDFRASGMDVAWVQGSFGPPLVGTPEQVADALVERSAIGYDGVTLAWVDYEDGLERFGAQVLPLLVQAGLRLERATA